MCNAAVLGYGDALGAGLSGVRLCPGARARAEAVTEAVGGPGGGQQ